MAAVVATAALYVLGISSDWSIGFDSGLYLNLARSLVSGKGYTLAGVPNAHVPPGYPVMLAGLLALFGKNFLLLNAVMCVIGLATLVLTYLLLRRLVHPDWAMAITLVVAACNHMFEQSTQELSDTPFMLLVVAGLLLYCRGLVGTSLSRRGWEVGSLLLVAACWFRVVGFPLVAGAVLGLVISSWRAGRSRAILNLALVGVGCAGSLAFFYMAYLASQGSTSATYSNFLTPGVHASFVGQWLVGPLVRVYGLGVEMPRIFISQRLPAALGVVIFVIPILLGMASRLRRGEAVGPLATFLYVGAILMVVTKMRARYLVPVMPLLVVYLLEGAQFLLQQLSGRVRKLPVAACLAGLVAVFLCGNVIKDAANIYQKHWTSFARDQQGGSWRGEYDASAYLRGLVSRGNVMATQAVGTLSDMECPSLSRQIRMSQPSDAQIDKLLAGLKIRYAVVILSGLDQRPFEAAMKKRLDARGRPVFDNQWARVYDLGAGVSLASPAR